MKRDKILNLSSFLLASLFSYAAGSKLLDVQKFQVELGQSEMLNFIAVPVSFIIPVVEILLAILVFVPGYRLVGMYASFSLMIVFTTYIIIIMNYSYYIPCSCGGVLAKLGWREHLFFNGAFILVALAGILSHHDIDKKDLICKPRQL
ncbi:MauE/DoxX family redox-associated membrane protein [Chryseolinea soli]|uniref:Methylamine utilisation protein MauE domain-containing protein n=1 Tax=Chryseolinea soli TaxID=2321403 RepID=A0A385SM19_9BACT|nr:MauE/DoxX family redox-associated membrane protein [Chryseolinea soli]AYB32014.1 hypothetical protein D4L85_16210 [Chryseolinea soli]